jgi:spermidine/putrescine transport system ATP-binding protein
MKSETRQSRPAVETSGLVKRFGNFTALKGVDLVIEQNEFFTLLGPSGCGKTTLLRLIAGFETPSEGDIKLMGEEIADLPPFNRPINTVFQNYALFPHMTVAENIGFGLKMLGRPSAEIKARVSEMLNLVQMEPMADRGTSQISGGQQQRVALARALAPEPKVLLLDEPLSALDYKLRKEMQVELKRLQVETGITFIFVTHDQEEALTMSDRIAVISSGNVLQVGTPVEIYHSPTDRFVADFVGESNFLPGKVLSCSAQIGTVDVCGSAVNVPVSDQMSKDELVTVMIRPEHLDVVDETAEGSIKAVIKNVVFFGTDTHLLAELADGTPLTIRAQNRADSLESFTSGQTVWVAVQPGAARIVRDRL